MHWECKLCKSKSHISALCSRFDELKSNEVPESQSNICYNTGSQEQQYILPIVNICVQRNNKNYFFNCLLDTGSQRTYFSNHILKTIKCDDSDVTPK